MSSVTFNTSVGGDGSTVTDDTSPTTGLDGGGHRTRFVPALAQVVVVAANTVTKAGEALAAKTAADQAAAVATAKAAEATSNGAVQVALATTQAQLATTNGAVQVSLASGHALSAAAAANTATVAGTTAQNNAAAAGSSAAAANATLLGLGAALSQGVGAMTVNANGELVATWNEPTVTAMSIDGSGNLQVTYP